MTALTAKRFWSDSVNVFVAALALVTAFSWRDAIDSTFTTYIKNPLLSPNSVFRRYPNLPRFMYAIVLTITVTIITFYVQK